MFSFISRSADLVREKFAVTKDVNEVLSLIYTSRSFELSVMMGLIPGYSTVGKFGENPAVSAATTPEDITEIGGEYTYDDFGTAPIVSLISNSGLDTMPIKLVGLDIDGNEVEQEITLTGVVRVALTTPLYRVYRMENEGAAGDDINGIVYCYVGTGGLPSVGDTRAIIDNGNNQTLMAVYTIPTAKVGFLYRGELGVSRQQSAGEVRASYRSARLGKVFKVKKRVNVSNSGSSIYQDERVFPDPIPALTDIKLHIESVSANDMGVTGTFHILLVDADQFTDTFLVSIGQPS